MILTLVCDAGMRDDILLVDLVSNWYVLWDGKLWILLYSIESVVLGDFLMWLGKIWVGLGVIGIRSSASGKEESVKEFVSRNLGMEVFECLIELFCLGVYVGDFVVLLFVVVMGCV